MTTLAEHIIVAGAENRPPMLEKSMYDSWASRIRLFIKGKKHGRMMLDSIDNGPLVYPTVEENRQTRPKKYSELTEAQQLQDDCDVQATNIILHGLPPDVYALVNHQEAAKDIWDRVKMLMKGTELSYQERECRLYNLFDKFAHVPGETLYEYYWRFSQLINDMHTIGMTMQQVQVNTKFLNALPSEWSKFVTDVKLAKSLYTTNYDQLYAYLSQHERHANEVRISRERYPNSFAFQGEDLIECINKAMAFLSSVASRFPPSNNQLTTSSNPRNQATIQDGNRGIATTSKGNVAAGQPRVVKCYNCQREGNMARQCTQPKSPRNSAWFKEKLMLAKDQEADCDDLSSAKAVLMGNLLSYDPEVLSKVPYSDSYLNDMINQDVQEMQYSEQTHVDDFEDNEIHSGSNIIPYSQYLQDSQDAVIQDSNPSAPNDLLVLSLVEQMTDYIAHLDKENQTNKMVNESLIAELKRYKERIAIFEQRLNVDLNQREKLIDSQMDDLIHDRNSKLAAFQQEIDTLKETLSNNFKEKESVVLKDTFNAFDKTLLDEITEVQTIFNQIEAAVDQCSVDKNIFEIQIKQLRIDNDQLLNQIMSQEIVHIVANSVDILDVKKSCVNDCSKCLELETELLKKKDFIEKEAYDKLVKSYSTLEKHCISLELATQLNQEIFQRENSGENLNAPTFNQLFEINELKAQSQEKDTVIRKLKDRIKSLSGKDSVENVKKDIDEIETINIELEHSVAKLLSKNENLRKEREHLKSIYKDQFDSIRKTRVQSKEHCDSLIAQINAKSVENSDLNAQLQEKVFAITTLKNELRKLKGKNVVNTAVSKPNATIAPGMFKLDIEPISPRLKNNRDAHEVYIEKTIEYTDTLRGFVESARTQNPSEPLLESACMFTKHVQELLVYVSQTCPSSPKPSGKLVAVTPMNKDKRVRFAEPVTSSSNIPKQTDSLKTKDSNKPLLTSTGVKPTTSASGSKPSGNTKNNRITRPPRSNQKNKVKDHSRNVKSSLNKKNSISEPISIALVKHSLRNAKFESMCAICNKCLFEANHDMCLINHMNDVNVRSKSKSKRNKKRKAWKPTGSSKKAKIVESDTANNSESTHLWGSNATDVPSSSSLVNDRSSKSSSGTVRFKNDQVAKIMGYDDYQQGNVIISRVYYVEGLRHNLFSVGQFCDVDLEVAFRKNTCFIRNFEGVDLLSGSHDTNLYTISLDDMLKTSPISYALGKSKKSSHQPKAEDTNQEKLYILQMDLCGPMRVESINGVKFLRSKDEAPDAIIKCIKNIQVHLNATVRNVRTDNGTEFVNQTLHDLYENVGISHQTSVARTPQQNGVVERRNRNLVEASRTMLIFLKAPLFLWAEAINTAVIPKTVL
ncbi:retrovirus-related pol polyprotein from transposon TNT 1-94 [Tanacetum coccineum]